jgi:hypothetical protein
MADGKSEMISKRVFNLRAAISALIVIEVLAVALTSWQTRRMARRLILLLCLTILPQLRPASPKLSGQV